MEVSSQWVWKVRPETNTWFTKLQISIKALTKSNKFASLYFNTTQILMSRIPESLFTWSFNVTRTSSWLWNAKKMVKRCQYLYWSLIYFLLYLLLKSLIVQSQETFGNLISIISPLISLIILAYWKLSLLLFTYFE